MPQFKYTNLLAQRKQSVLPGTEEPGKNFWDIADKKQLKKIPKHPQSHRPRNSQIQTRKPGGIQKKYAGIK